MSEKKSGITVQRDVEAVQIPSGQKITIHKGNAVVITQALGGSFTVVMPQQAGLFRIASTDADALGKTVNGDQVDELSEPTEEAVWAMLRTCFDPEIPVNIVDLGLVYSMEMKEVSEGKMSVDVAMTLTAPGCGMGPTIAEDARQKVLTLPWVESASFNIVWEPGWNPRMISEEGRKQLGMDDD